MRLNEHAFPTWDSEVVFDDSARFPSMQPWSWSTISS